MLKQFSCRIPYFWKVRQWEPLSEQNATSFMGCLLELFKQSDKGIVLNSNGAAASTTDLLAAFGTAAEIKCGEDANAFEQLKKFLDDSQDWAFGHFSYDLKNPIEHLSSQHRSGIDFAALNFFVPEIIFRQKKGQTEVGFTNEKQKQEYLSLLGRPVKKKIPFGKVYLQARISKAAYLTRVEELLHHIHIGDIYEINFCMEFFAENIHIDPVRVFERLNALTNAPFSALYKNGDQWLLCASPERFMQKTGNRIISQPIKGTRPRGKTPEEDARLKEELLHDEKERSENVMIVDLVRNDLSKSAKKASVKVEELFGIHSFQTVHQMISTVSAELKEGVHATEAIRNAFPMGSMTGAPKIRAMQLAEASEQMRRGLYSGALGYFKPELDFDLNVVIRSIQYNERTGYLSVMAGSAITAKSDPEKEYEECLVKAASLFRALQEEA